MVDHEAADVGRAGTVKLNGGQVGRIGRQDVVAVAGRREGNHEARRRADGEGDRNDRRDGGGLGVHELRDEEQHDGVGPRRFTNPFGEDFLEVGQVGGEHRVGHPSHTVHGHDGDHAGVEDGGLGDGGSLRLAEGDHEGAGRQHEHLNGERHREGLAAGGGTQRREHAEDGDHGHGTEEDVERSPLFGTELDADEGRRFAVDVLALFRILDEFLEGFVLVEVLAAEEREGGEGEDADDGRRDHDGEELREAEGLTADFIAVQEGDHRDGGHGGRRADHAHLSGNGRSGERTFRTDAVLDGHVVDNREHRVDDVTRTAENRQEPADVGGEVADEARMTAEHLFRDLQQAVETARSLQGGRSAHHGENRENHVDRGLARLEAEAEDEDDQADAADEAEAHAAFTGTVKERRKHDQELDPKV